MLQHIFIVHSLYTQWRIVRLLHHLFPEILLSGKIIKAYRMEYSE